MIRPGRTSIAFVVSGAMANTITGGTHRQQWGANTDVHVYSIAASPAGTRHNIITFLPLRPFAYGPERISEVMMQVWLPCLVPHGQFQFLDDWDRRWWNQRVSHDGPVHLIDLDLLTDPSVDPTMTVGDSQDRLDATFRELAKQDEADIRAFNAKYRCRRDDD